ncbi:DUF5777 family beta-barrel protein [Flavobacteriaceae bacterium KMM 6897]|nr:DUF5777 family beta-barrel protein [Flavobacteriaceae bacterium KMM 6897]
MRTRKIVFLVFITIGYVQFSNGQELLELLDKEQKEVPEYTSATFKMTRIAIGHSIETRKKGILEIFVANRFWNTPNPQSESFFVDRLSTRFALEYGVTDRLSVGLGGTSYDGLFDGYLKYKLIRQRGDGKGSPFSITLMHSSTYNSNAFPNLEGDFSNRLSFASQVLVAKKFSPDFSLQIAPSFIHRGQLLAAEDPRNHFAIGFGGRYKLGHHLSFVSEYYYIANPIKSFDTYGPFAIGVNWELGDLMLQFMLTNAQRIADDAFITQTRLNFNFKNPNLNFGFNATYVIHFKSGLKK